VPSNRHTKRKEQKPEPPTVIGIVKMAAIAVTAKISSIKKMTIGRVQERLQELLKGKKYIGPLKKQIINAIGSLRNLDLNQQEQVWNMIQSILDTKSTTESVTLFS
jgi:hypothetical protein